MAAAASGFLALGVFVLVGLLIIAAIIYALILLAIEYWYISVPVISLIILAKTLIWKKNRKNKKTTYQYTNQQNTNQQNTNQHTTQENTWSNNRQYHRREKKREQEWDYDRKKSHNDSWNSPFDGYWDKLYEIQRRRDEATDHLWDKYFESDDDDISDQIYEKINEIDEMFDEEEDELWSQSWNDDWNTKHEEYHEEYEQKTRDGGWKRDKAYEKAWDNWQKAKQEYEDATGQKYSSDWYENFNWDDLLGEESVNIDECYKTLGLSTNATMKEVKIRYRELALKHHPDRCKDKKHAEEKFKEIAEAYEQIKKKHLEAEA